ncbi:MAG: YbaK/EbsC family protein [Halofilum sp. (in: g-proteobacteria)]
MAGRSVGLFRAALLERGLADTIVELDASARTAIDAAAALGCATGAIVKSLVFRGPGAEPLLVLGTGDGRVDEALVGERVGGPVALADAGFVRDAAGYAIGGVPPFGHRRDLPTLIDARLERFALIWAAAGTPETVFSLSLQDLIHATGGEVVEVGRG